MRTAADSPPSRFRAAPPYRSSNGVADGSIIPAIITAHIAQSSSRCGPSHTIVIIHFDAPDIGPYISAASTTTQVHASNGRAIRTTASAARSWRRAASIRVGRVVTRNDYERTPAPSGRPATFVAPTYDRSN